MGVQVRNDIEILEQTATELLDFDYSNGDIYRYISEKLMLFSGASIVFVNENENNLAITKNVSGLGDRIVTATKILGFNPNHLKLAINEETFIFLQSGKLDYCSSIYQLALKQVPKIICQTLETVFRVNEIYQIGFPKNNVVFGGAAFIFRNNETLKSKELVEAFSRQVAICLQKKKAEELLKESERRFREIFENTPIGIYRCDSAGNAQIANPTTYKIFGQSFEIDSLLLENRRALLASLSIDNNVSQKKFSFSLPNGEDVHYIETIKKIRDIHGKVSFEGSIIDITELHETKLALENAMNKAAKIAWTQSHEVRSPLASIMGLIPIIKNENKNKELETYLDMMAESCEKLDDVIKKITNLST